MNMETHFKHHSLDYVPPKKRRWSYFTLGLQTTVNSQHLDFKVPDKQMVKLCSAWPTELGMLLTCPLLCFVIIPRRTNDTYQQQLNLSCFFFLLYLKRTILL